MWAHGVISRASVPHHMMHRHLVCLTKNIQSPISLLELNRAVIFPVRGNGGCKKQSQRRHVLILTYLPSYIVQYIKMNEYAG